MKTASCRMTVLMARDASVAVIIRRGPSKWFQIVRWDTSSDTFKEGAWFHGRIYEDKCHVSPDGRLLVYLAAQHKQTQRETGYDGIWTAVSRPPWLTALALWPSGSGTWGGGGMFLGPKKLLLFWGSDQPHPDHLPNDLAVSFESYEDRQARASSSAQDCPVAEADWSGFDQSGRVVFTRGGRLFKLMGGREEVELADFMDRRPTPMPSPDWARR